MTSFMLKIIACVIMLCDHVAYTFFDQTGIWYQIGRIIGRSAFYLFAFLLVEGFFHTKSLKKYFISLSIFALISEAAFDFFCFGSFSITVFNKQSVYVTLLLGLVSVTLIDRLRKLNINNTIYTVYSALVILGTVMLSFFMRADYGGVGVVCILIFYFFRGNRKFIVIGMAVWVFLCYCMGLYGEEWGLVSLIVIFLYNGKRGRYPKYIFYAFYPAHLLLIGLIKMLAGS